MPLPALRPGDVRRLVEGVSATKSPQTGRNVRDILRLVLARQVDLEVIDRNPAAAVRSPAAGKAAARFLTAAEADALQAAADGHPRPVIGAVVAFALGTGLRVGEMRALEWGRDGVDLEARVVHVTATRDRTGVNVVPKSRRHRDVPLGDDLVRRMKAYRLATGRPRDGDRVFGRCHKRAWDDIRKIQRPSRA